MEPRGADGPSARPAAGDVAARVRASGGLPAEVRRGGRAAGGLPQPRGPRALPVHHQGRPARTPTPSGCSPCRWSEVRRLHASSGTTGRPTVVGYTEHDLSMWADVVARSIRAAGGRPGPQGPCRVRLRAVHRRSRRALRRRAGRLHGDPGVRRHDGASGADHPGLRAGDHHGHPVVHAHAARRVRAAGRRSARRPRCGWGSSAPSRGPRGCGPEIEERFAIDAVDIYGLSEVIGPGVAQECVETKDGLHIWEDHFLPEVVDPLTDEVLARGRERRAGAHLADQGGAAGDPLPHPGPDPAAARHRAARLPADGEGHRPLRRHDHPARGERLPEPDRGDRAAHARRWRRTSGSS